MDFSQPTVSPGPLDSGVTWARRDVANVGAGYTNEILSLISDNAQKNSYSWPLYIELRGTTNPQADMNTSQSAGSVVRLFNQSTGSPWMVGFHSEIWHAQDPSFSPVHAHGTSIGFNCEVGRKGSTGTTVGVNIQNVSHSTGDADSAVQIQSSTGGGWANGILFQGVDRIAGNIGINFGTAKYNLGIDLADNGLRLNANQKIILERFGTVWIQYNSDTGHVELYKDSKLVKNLDE
jgi:hypothetical protein